MSGLTRSDEAICRTDSSSSNRKHSKDVDIIIALTLYVTGKQVYGFKDTKPEKQYEGTLTFFGQNIAPEKMWRSLGGYGFQPEIVNEEGETVLNQVGVSLYSDDEGSVYDGDRITNDVNITFKPERPKSKENFNIVIPDEECLVFDTFNFKLAVVNELMYNQLVLKPYFDIYDYMAFKKAHWNLPNEKRRSKLSETERTAVMDTVNDFFLHKKEPIIFLTKDIEDRSLELADMIKDKQISKRKAVAMLKKEFPDHLDKFYKAMIIDSLSGARWYK